MKKFLALLLAVLMVVGLFAACAKDNGDVNNDGTVNSVDANIMKRIRVGFSVSHQAVDAADINEDGAVNSMDAALLKRTIA